jgi:hypothetical protein
MNLTPLMEGKIPYSRIRKNEQKNNVIQELEFRLGEEEVSRRNLAEAGIMHLVNDILRPHEFERTKKMEIPLSHCRKHWMSGTSNGGKGSKIILPFFKMTLALARPSS